MDDTETQQTVVTDRVELIEIRVASRAEKVSLGCELLSVLNNPRRRAYCYFAHHETFD